MLNQIMSKREIFPQSFRDSKRPKLDTTISDHNFPISENNENGNKTWADDNEDEILVLASQVCEANYISNTTVLPDYSLCMQPQSTSTQLFQPTPHTSRHNDYAFKKPTSILNGQLPSTSREVYADDFHNSLKEENLKLKLENVELSKKFLVKEGEARLLRDNSTQHQKTLENLKLVHTNAQEQTKQEFKEQLAVVHSEIENLKAQLDYKNLEVMKLKKRNSLDSANVRVTQVTVPANDTWPRYSHRNKQDKKSVNDTGVQTDFKKNILKLNKPYRNGSNQLTNILKLILEDYNEDTRSVLDHDTKLQKHVDFSHSKCIISSAIHKFPLLGEIASKTQMPKLSLSSLSYDLAYLMESKDNHLSQGTQLKYISISNNIKKFLHEVLRQLQTLSQRVTVAFQKEMDQEYIEATSSFVHISKTDLLKAKSLHSNEQAIAARRATAVLAVLTESDTIARFIHAQDENRTKHSSDNELSILDVLCKICGLIDTCCAAVLYSGLLISIIQLIENFWQLSEETFRKVLQIIGRVIISRPLYTVVYHAARTLRRMALTRGFLRYICSGKDGTVKLDNDKGVLFFKRDACVLYIFCKQMESALKCMADDGLAPQVAFTTQQIMALYNNIKETNKSWSNDTEKFPRCDCLLMIQQVIIYALHLCALLLNKNNSLVNSSRSELETLCRIGLTLLYQWQLSDAHKISLMAYYEGFYLKFVDACESMKGQLRLDNTQMLILSGLVTTLPGKPDETRPPSPKIRDIWIQSFTNFNISDDN